MDSWNGLYVVTLSSYHVSVFKGCIFKNLPSFTGVGQTRNKKLVPRELSSESKEGSESTREGVSPNCQPNILDDDGFPTYARLRQEHPYDKLRKCMLTYSNFHARMVSV